MTDIIDRLTHEIDYAQGILIEDALCAMEDARDEIVRLRGELENVERDRMAQVEVERLRQDVQFWTDEARKFKESSRHNYAECARLRALVAEWAEADSANDFMANDTAAIRYARAMEALREEVNR